MKLPQNKLDNLTKEKAIYNCTHHTIAWVAFGVGIYSTQDTIRVHYSPFQKSAARKTTL